MTFIDEKVSPNGKITVYYQSAGPRLYRVNGVEVPSVSGIAKIADEIPQWWGMRTGIKGVQELQRDGKLYTDWENLPHRDIERLLTANKLCVNTVLKKTADRGTDVHRALEDWAAHGEWPDPEKFPEHERGYVVGVTRFLEDFNVELTRSEIMVGSAEHGFAGRFDLRAKQAASTFCVDVKRGIYEEFDAGVYLWDMKTSSGFYVSHFLQLAGYDGASIECGYPPSDARCVLRVTEDGLYEVKRSHARFEDFLAVLNVWKSLEALKVREREAKKAAKEAAKDAP